MPYGNFVVVCFGHSGVIVLPDKRYMINVMIEF